MDCYKFEENISAFIDGELTHSVRVEFIHHKESCNDCNDQLEGVLDLLNNISHIDNITTSSDFMVNLEKRIESHNNKEDKLFFRPGWNYFGLRPISALGFAAAICALTISSYLLFQEESVPIVNTADFSGKHTQSKTQYNNFNPSLLTASTNDSTHNVNDSLQAIKDRFDDQIQTVGQQKSQ